MKVLVENATSAAALAVIRSLGSKGNSQASLT